MDSDRQIDTLEEHLEAFLETREDALWLLNYIRQKVKHHYPDERLTQQQEPGEPEEPREHTTNQVEGNIWMRLRVLFYSSSLTLIGDC